MSEENPWENLLSLEAFELYKLLKTKYVENPKTWFAISYNQLSRKLNYDKDFIFLIISELVKKGYLSYQKYKHPKGHAYRYHLARYIDEF